MKKQFVKYFLLVVCMGLFVHVAEAQKGKAKPKPRAAQKRSSSKTAKGKTNAKVKPTAAVVDSIPAPPPVAAAPKIDSLPIKVVLPSLRRDAAVDDDALRDKTPLPYENLRSDDALFRHKIWREIDAREKINLPFRYSADENNGNQRFVSILFKAIQDSAVTVFDAVDDRFTTPMTISQVATKIAGDSIPVTTYDSLGNPVSVVYKRNDVNLDSFYKFQVKEEVIFDKESSRLFWRILGIAPLKRIVTTQGLDLGETPMFWVYYPDMRPVFAKYEVYNGKNFGARMSWEELFESRMFYGRIIKSTIDNPYDLAIKSYKGLEDKPILQLLEGENIKEKIFNYEQDLWSY
ncbi:type IX secretion system ring subunit PorN/GldN [Ferruginibacter sp.]